MMEMARQGKGGWSKAFFSMLLMLALVVGARAGDTGLPETEGTDHHAQRLLAARCTVCHSIELIIQQRLDREHWGTIVKKMSTWGAQVSESEQDTLVAYLASRYHPDAGPALSEEPAARLFPSIDKAQGNAKRGQGLYGHNCLPCHGPQGAGGVGPKLAGNQVLTDTPRFWEMVLNGRGGMPPWGTTLTGQEIADIHSWLQTLK
jgi:cytochrome c oxidase cbb3-type subunit III